MRKNRIIAAALLIGTLAGCGSEEAGPACPAGAACGGEIAPGRYRVESYCATFDGPVKFARCEEAHPVDISGVVVTGSYTFNADKSFRAELTRSGVIAEVFPWQCLTTLGSRATNCAEVAVAINDSLRDPDAPFETVSCTGASSCTCAYVLKEERVAYTGRYTTLGSELVLSPVGFIGEPTPYCATANRITMAAKIVQTGTDVMSTSRNTTVLVKE
jgi:hypothetical protein